MRFVSLVVLGLIAAGCTGEKGTSGPSVEGGTVTVAGFAVARDVYEKGLLPAWAKTEGKGVKIRQTYDGSGAQTRAILGGLDADIAALSLEPEIDQLKQAGKVAEGPIFPAYSIVVIAVRPGNPKNITSFASLRSAGVEVVLPNPDTSGAAKWNLAAIMVEESFGSPDKTSNMEATFRQLRPHVVSFGKSGREAMQQWAGGVGDAIITWENEAILRQKTGTALEIVVPAQTLKMEPPVALLKPAKPPAKKLYDWLGSPEAVTLYKAGHYRTADRTTEGVHTIGEMGGWQKVDPQLFGPEGAWAKSGR